MFSRKHSLSGRRVLITGASSGIGRALVEQCVAAQARVLMTARRAERLDALAERLGSRGASQVVVLPGDVTDTDHRQQLMATAIDAFGGLDVLINNAGIGGIGTFASATEHRLRRIMEVNFFAPVELIRAALPLLRQSDQAVVVNIGSVLGHCAVPKKSEYCASKFALQGMTAALRIELADEGIDVLMVSPSTTRSEFFDQAERSEGRAARNRHAMAPERVARATLVAITTRRRDTILSCGGKVLIYANRVAPGLLSRLLRRFG